MRNKFSSNSLTSEIISIDSEYSKRFIHLDPNGYFIIKLDLQGNTIIVEHYTNNLDELGRATDPKTGKPIKCTTNKKRQPIAVYQGRSAKEVGIQLTEGENKIKTECIDHALYLGRELQKAEYCLINKIAYIQD
ncbi:MULTISPECIES: DUF4346 domain-containing protein [Prochlorococcus]|uniref:DUF4346 domain-containing protein n=1 Tax=Prochlorococcus TaxID=1218 RepID=UPI0005338466|nr:MULTISPECIES: DUF4346 domain-containing protein [Prochlorococcus]KGG13272.1 Pterin-binding family [Prochlorococcus sp. MIT 0601]